MGYSVVWFAVPEEHGDAFLAKLGLAETGVAEDEIGSSIVSAKLTSGWRLIWHDHGPIPEETTLALASECFDVLHCVVLNICTSSFASLWSDGSELWSICHDGSEGAHGIEAKGSLPECFAAIRDEFTRRQAEAGGATADVDYLFEIPLEVAKQLVGFKHDENWDHIFDGPFQVLEQVATVSQRPKQPLLSKLFMAVVTLRRMVRSRR